MVNEEEKEDESIVEKEHQEPAEFNDDLDDTQSINKGDVSLSNQES